MERKMMHLQMIQSIVAKMGQNSFFLKGWTVTLVAALFAIASQGANYDFLIFAYVPILMFWLLDGYFLYQEKLFRNLYDMVRMKREEQIDFNMATSQVDNSKLTVVNVALSKTIIIFYLPIVMLLAIVMVLFPF